MESLGWRPESNLHRALQTVALGKLEKSAELGADAIEPLMMVLKSDVYYKRMQAVEALSRIPEPRVVKPLIEALKDSDNHVRVTAVEALAHIGDPRAVDPLIMVLRDKDSRLRAATVSALSKLADPRSIDPIAKLIKDESWDVRMAALEALGKIKDPKVIIPLVACLRDKDRDARLAAVQSLGKVGESSAIEALVLSLADEFEPVRQAANASLRRIDKSWEKSEGARKALPALHELSNSKDYWVRQAAGDMVHRLGDGTDHRLSAELSTFADPVQRKKLGALQALLATIKDTDRDLRQASAECLGKLGDSRAAEALVEALTDSDEWVRQSAAEALVALQWQAVDPKHQALLMVTLEKWDIVETLGTNAIDALNIAIHHADSNVRRRAASTLGKLEIEPVIPLLIPLLKDPQASVRRSAGEALEKLKWQPEDPAMRARQLAEMGRWKDIAPLGAQVLPMLEECARDKQQDRLQWSAAEEAIGLMDDPAAAERLFELTQQPELATVAAMALRNILQKKGAQLSMELLEQLTGVTIVQQANYELDRQLGYVQSTVTEIDASSLAAL
ncbi:MAG TPA: HEAT repeat domain-containing protein, partial [Roseimicrobium sp.]|nr:HEAT repeat domain-containing protein [Roseimicrobium sp.]